MAFLVKQLADEQQNSLITRGKYVIYIDIGNDAMEGHVFTERKDIMNSKVLKLYVHSDFFYNYDLIDKKLKSRGNAVGI